MKTFYLLTGFGIPEIGLTLVSREVQVHGRTISVAWVPELTLELEMYHGIDTEYELSAILAEEVAQQIDNEIIENLRNRLSLIDDYDIKPFKLLIG